MSDAVFFTVDSSFLPLALATAAVLVEEEGRTFDVLILLKGEVDDALTVPDGVHVIPNDLSERVPETTGFRRPWGAIAYTRIFAPYLLESYRHLLYLDSDIAAFGPIAPLFRLDMGGHPLAAVEGMMEEGTILSGFDLGSYKEGLGLGDSRMFNSGVLLIDVEAWCRIDHERSLHDYVRDVQPKLKVRTGLAGDQEYLNRLMAGRWLQLSPIWNFQNFLMKLALETAVDPALVHYVGGVARPWVADLYPFGQRHSDYYRRNLDRIGLPDASRYHPRDHRRRKATNALRHFWFDRLNIAAKRGRFDSWQRARTAYRRAIADRLDAGDYADVAQGLASVDLASDPFVDIGFDEVTFHRKFIWPRRLAT